MLIYNETRFICVRFHQVGVVFILNNTSKGKHKPKDDFTMFLPCSVVFV